MASKPSVVPVWNTGANNRITPSAGKKILGDLPNERPPAQYRNWLHGLAGDWFQYLSDGVISGAWSFLDGLSAAANKHIAVSGTGRFKHGDMVKNISPMLFSSGSGWADGGTVFFGDSGYVKSTGAGHIVFPIPMVEGERIKSLVFARFGDATGPDFTALQVFKLGSNGTATDITAAATTDTDPAAAWADKTVDVTDTTCAAGDTFWFHAAANAALLRIGSIRVTYDRP